MDYRSLHMKTVVDLRKIAKEENIRIPAGTSKAVLVEMIREKQKQNAQEAPAQAAANEAAPAEAPRRRGRLPPCSWVASFV